MENKTLLSNGGLALGIAATALVFGIGFCGLVGAGGGWVGLVGVPLYVCGASSAFLGLLGMILSLVALFTRQQSRATAATGLVLGLVSICLFLAFLRAIGGG